MMKKILTVIIAVSLMLNSAGQGYALRPMARSNELIKRKPEAENWVAVDVKDTIDRALEYFEWAENVIFNVVLDVPKEVILNTRSSDSLTQNIMVPLIGNAVESGSSSVNINARITMDELVIEVSDQGGGINLERLASILKGKRGRVVELDDGCVAILKSGEALNATALKNGLCHVMTKEEIEVFTREKKKELPFVGYLTTKPRPGGIGLSLARCTARQCGGNIVYKNGGKGTTITIRLPITKPSSAGTQEKLGREADILWALSRLSPERSQLYSKQLKGWFQDTLEDADRYISRLLMPMPAVTLAAVTPGTRPSMPPTQRPKKTLRDVAIRRAAHGLYPDPAETIARFISSFIGYYKEHCPDRALRKRLSEISGFLKARDFSKNLVKFANPSVSYVKDLGARGLELHDIWGSQHDTIESLIRTIYRLLQKYRSTLIEVEGGLLYVELLGEVVEYLEDTVAIAEGRPNLRKEQGSRIITDIEKLVSSYRERYGYKTDQDIEKGVRENTEVLSEIIGAAATSRYCRSAIEEAKRRRDETAIEFKLVVVKNRISRRKMLVNISRLKSAIANLIENAISVGARNIIVRIGLSKDNRTFSLAVEDDGSGMDEATRKRAAELDFTTKPKGTGLGLFEAKLTAETHNGKLKIRSRPGKGSKIAIEIPVSAHSPRASSAGTDKVVLAKGIDSKGIRAFHGWTRNERQHIGLDLDLVWQRPSEVWSQGARFERLRQCLIELMNNAKRNSYDATYQAHIYENVSGKKGFRHALHARIFQNNRPYREDWAALKQNERGFRKHGESYLMDYKQRGRDGATTHNYGSGLHNIGTLMFLSVPIYVEYRRSSKGLETDIWVVLDSIFENGPLPLRNKPRGLILHSDPKAWQETDVAITSAA